MSKIAVITLTAGEGREFARINHSTFKRYADKIGADFLVYSDFKLPEELTSVLCDNRNYIVEKVYLKKLIAIQNALNKYDRILYLDDSCYINKECPDLFSFVPENFMAMHNEGMTEVGRVVANISNCTVNRLGLKQIPINNYFNSGIILASKMHQHIFSVEKILNPINQRLFQCKFPDQTYLNYIVAKENIPYLGLGVLFSKMYTFDKCNQDYADVSGDNVVKNLVNIKEYGNNFTFLNNSVFPGNANHAFIYHVTSIWDNEQRLKISTKLMELGI